MASGREMAEPMRESLEERIKKLSPEIRNILRDTQDKHAEMVKHHKLFIELAAETRVRMWQLRQLGLSHSTLAMALGVTPAQVHKAIIGYARTGHDTPRNKRG